MELKRKNVLYICFLFLIFLMFFYVVKSATIFGAGTEYNTSEQGGDSPYFFNFSQNVTLGDYEEVNSYSIDDSQESEYIMLNDVLLNEGDIEEWAFMNSSTGILTINSTIDNRTGLLQLPLAVTVSSSGGSDTLRRMYNFTIYALNDVLYFVNLRPDYTYIFPTNETFFESYNITIYDEEQHYPLNYTLNFTNCTHAFWLNKTNGEDCDLFNLTSHDENNNILYLNYSPNNEDVGIYNATLTIEEGNHTCPHDYCFGDYEDNHVITQDLIFQVLSQLEVNISDCYNFNFVENQTDSCEISVKTRDPVGDLIINSSADFARFGGIPSQEDWFFSYDDNKSSEDFYEVIEINLTPEKKNIGNWTISFNVYDNITDERNITEIPIFVQRDPLLNSEPTLTAIDSVFTSTGKEESVLFRVYDDDLLIEDKLDGYNEQFNVSYEIINQSDMEDVSSQFDGLIDIEIVYPHQYNFNQYDIFGVNSFLTGNVILSDSEGISLFQKIGLFFKNFFKNNFLTGFFGYSSSEEEEIQNYSIVIFNFSSTFELAGNYTFNLNVSDNQESYDTSFFDVEIFTNQPPVWNQSTYDYELIVNSTEETSIENFTNLNLSDGFVSDADNDWADFTFLYDSTNSPDSFSVLESGFVNFIPYKSDVGYYEFNVSVSDGFLEGNSLWRINVTNTNSLPEIDRYNEGYFRVNDDVWNSSTEIVMHQNNNLSLNFKVYDDDLLIDPLVYLEELDYNVSIINNTEVYEPISLDFSKMSFSGFSRFSTQITPGFLNVGEYTILFNVSDKENESDTHEFNLTILEVNSAPSIHNLENLTTTILDPLFYFTINASDQEDDFREIPLSYNLTRLDNGAPLLYLDNSTGVVNFDFNKNNNFTGVWLYNVSVKDDSDAITSQIFELTVHGLFNISFPNSSFIFNLTENESELFNFSLDYPINSTNFSYEFYLDGIKSFFSESNNVSYNYTDFLLRENGTFVFVNESDGNFSFEFSPNYSDEGYGNLTNISLFIQNDEFPALNQTFNWSTNISHQNSPLNFEGEIGDIGPVSVGSNINLSLIDYFSDFDYFDPHYSQNINFSLNLVDGGPGNVVFSSYFEDWTLVLRSLVSANEIVNVTGYEWDEGGNQINNLTSNNFNVSFIPPEEIETPRSEDGRVIRNTAVKHYALKIITPGNLHVSNQDYIEFNFSVFNSGMVDLYGIDLRGLVELENEFTGDLNITFSPDYIDELLMNDSKTYTARIDMATEAVGRYDITLFGDVTTPKFTDWSKFYVDIQGLEESELSQLVLFTEKFVSENPECLELTEVLTRAQGAFDSGNLAESERLTRQVINACEESISANEQRRWMDNEIPIDKSFLIFFILSIVLLILVLAYNYYKKIKFKKSKNDEYI